jgi:leucyl-tRNA synthetase
MERRAFLDRYRLAYLDEVPVNWCPALGTVLANEEVTNEGLSNRGNHPVFRRPLQQWMLRITKYADRLLADIDELDWPEPIKIMQRNWIGRSTGAEVLFPLAGPWTIEGGRLRHKGDGGSGSAISYDAAPDAIRVYTTRPDTLFGATYMVLAPEHELVDQITTPEQRASVEAYVKAAATRSELDRTADTKEKTGVFTGAYAINPVNGQSIPIWIADYVLMGYGTGAIMAVPAHDTRDFEFTKTFELPLVAVVQPDDGWFHEQIMRGALDQDYCARHGKPSLVDELMQSAARAAGTLGGITAQDATAVLDGDTSWVNQVVLPVYRNDPGIFAEAFVGEGRCLNSPGSDGRAACPLEEVCALDGLWTAEAKAKITAWLERSGLGRAAVNYKLRDWIFSRQKYWGEPFPVLHAEDGGTIAVAEAELPVELPPMEDFKPTTVGDDVETLPEPPLGRAAEWVHVERDGRRYRRDLNTMPQWAGSCWYYLRFIDPGNTERFCDPEAERYWSPVDLYVGGAEHAVLHLLYARFWHKVLFDLGYVHTREPFRKLFNQGMIQGFAYRDRRGRVLLADEVEEQGPDQFTSRETGEPVSRVIAKMSKSLKNVVSPDEIVSEWGADTFRLYEMYMGPLDASKPWNTRDVPGLYKLCQRIWRLVIEERTGVLSSKITDDEPDVETRRALHKLIKRVAGDVEQLKLNTAIAAIFDFVNFLTPRDHRPRAVIEPFVLVTSPFTPHIAEELWHRLGHAQTLADEPWPAYDEDLARDEEVEIGVQISGKLKARVLVPADATEEQIQSAAMAAPKVTAALEGKTVRKVIVVKGRLVNIVAG